MRPLLHFIEKHDLTLTTSRQTVPQKTKQYVLCAILSIGALLNTRYAQSQVSFSTTALPSGMEFASAGTGLVQTPDINNDGFPDIIYTTSLGGPITYLQNNGGTSLSTPSPNPFASYTSSSPAGTVFNLSTSIADYDGDGDLDIWVRVNGSGNDVYLRNDAGTYVTGTVLPGMEFTFPNTTNVQVADINQDGLPDIAYNTTTGGAITYLQNDGGTSFSTPASNPFANYTSSSPAGMSLITSSTDMADYDGDGDLDIWARVNGAGNDVYLRNDAGTYVTGTVLPGMEFTATGSGVGKVGDMNGDGLPDIFYNTSTAGALTYLQNNGGTSFSTPSPNPFAAYTSSTPSGVLTNNAATIADIDGDGDLDLWVRVSGATNDFYTTASGAAPGFVSTTPANNASSVSVSSNIVFNFTENVFAGTGSFYVRKSADNSIVETIAANGANVSGSGSTAITIDPAADLASGTSYYITFDRTALADADGLIAGHVDAPFKIRVPEQTADFLQFTTESTLPVKLKYFTAALTGDAVLLKWETATELNAKDFAVQHSTNGQIWKTITVIPAAGNTTDVQQYSYTHTSPEAGRNYYRLLQTNIDGKTEFSQVRTVELLPSGHVLLYPNPAGKTAFLKFDQSGRAEISIYNTAGVLVHRGIYSGSTVELPVGRLNAGLYRIVIDRNGEMLTRTLIIE